MVKVGDRVKVARIIDEIPEAKAKMEGFWLGKIGTVGDTHPMGWSVDLDNDNGPVCFQDEELEVIEEKESID